MSICIFGDSITWGASDIERGGWVERLKVYIGEKYDNEVYNLGISGENTKELLKRVESETIVRAPEAIVFAIGINDARYMRQSKTRAVSFEDFCGNIGKLYEIAKRFTDKIIFIGLTSVDEAKTTSKSWNPDNEYNNEGITMYDNAIKEFCLTNRVKFIGMKDALKLEDLEDGLHPNSAGHQKMYEIVKPQIEEILK